MTDYVHAKFVKPGTRFGSRKAAPTTEPLIEVQAGHGRALITQSEALRLAAELKNLASLFPTGPA